MEESGNPLNSGKLPTAPKKPSLIKRVSNISAKEFNDFPERLSVYCSNVYAADYGRMLGQIYYLEDNWNDFIGDSCMTDKMRIQQQGIWEFITTEKNYIRRIRVVCEVFKQVLRIAHREGDLLEISESEIFANINEILITNDNIWKDYFVQVLNKTRQTRRPIKPSELLAAFNETDELYKSYVNFTLDQEDCLHRIRDYSEVCNENKKDKKRNFKTYLEFCENLPQCERLKLVDLMTEPMQRITRYPLLLKSIHDYTENVQEKKQLRSMMNKFQGFIYDINKKKREIYEKRKLNDCLDGFDYYNTWGVGNEDVMWVAVDFLRGNVINVEPEEPRCILRQDAIKMIENKKNEVAVEALLFTDVLVLTRRRNSTKKLLVIKQLFFLDKIRFIKSEISNTSIVFLYLDEHGLLASSLMLELPEKMRDKWLQCLEKAKERFEKACSGVGSTLEFFKDENHRDLTSDTSDGDYSRLPFGNIKRNLSGKGSIHLLQDRRKEPVEENQDQNNDTKLFSLKRRESNKDQNQNTNEELPTTDYNQNETGINRRTASWVLTNERKVRSIRTLLREDLWGTNNFKKDDLRAVNRHHTEMSTETVDEHDETRSLTSASIDSSDLATSESELSIPNPTVNSDVNSTDN